MSSAHIDKEGKHERRGLVRDTLSTVAQALADCVGFEDFFDAVREALSPYIPHNAMGIYLYDEGTGTFRPLIHQTDEPIPEAVWLIHKLSPEKTLKYRVIHENKPHYTPDLTHADYAEAPLLRELGVGSNMIVPLFSRNRPRGVLYVDHLEKNAYDEFHLALLSELAAPVAVALEEVRELEKSRVLQQCGEDMTATLDIEEMLNRVSSRLQPVLPHSLACIFLVDESSGELADRPLACAKAPDFEKRDINWSPLPGSLRARILDSDEPLLAADIEQHSERFANTSQFTELGLHSIMACRLEMTGKPFAVFIMAGLRPCLYCRKDLESFLWVGRQLSLALSNALAFREVERLSDQLRVENLYLKNELTSQRNLTEIIGVSPALQKVLEQVEMVAATDSTALITGETGTGKELIARAIHQLGTRSKTAMIRVNCAALPRELIESEMFGHERGSFTGAERQHIGRFELANGGTLFLDEVGDMPLEAQSRLLRTLQEGEFERVGGEKPIRVDVRVIAATNQDLEKAVEAGRFRQDLFYRLRVFPIHVPPLRERPEDIIPLARHFALRFAGRLKKPVRRLSRASQQEMLRYSWPGNVRELEHMVERAVILTRTDVLDLVPLIKAESRLAKRQRKAFPSLETMEREHIKAALEEANGRLSGKGGAAELLGLPRTTLQARMRKLDIKGSRK